MAKNGLTGIERQLVLDYLMDGNADVTLSLVQEQGGKAVHPPVAPAVPVTFSVAPRAEQSAVLNQGGILLKGSGTAAVFSGKTVRVQFYFNKLALFFVTAARLSSAGLALALPEHIQKVEDRQEPVRGGFSATVFYQAAFSPRVAQKTDIVCGCDERFPLFIASDYRKRVAVYLSEPLPARTEPNALRIHAPSVIYVDSRRIVFASEKRAMPFSPGAEYALLLRFPISGPLRERKVFLSCVVEQMFESHECDRLCACARFSSIREEDERFLSDRMGVQTE